MNTTPQTEAQLEEELIQQLGGLGYERVAIRNEQELLANLKHQLEKHNGVQLADDEFQQVLAYLAKGTVFEKAALLRDRVLIRRNDAPDLHLELLNQDKWCQNQYQVTHQITLEGAKKNRYDVTLLINGLPLVQIELKRRGIELKEAFKQINRYQRHSFGDAANGLFQYVQLFVISNGVNTKYYANNRKQFYGLTYHWTDAHNKPINKLSEFAEAFLEKCHLSKMICRYIVQHQSWQTLMVLRPYQYYAVEKLMAQVTANTAEKENGYIWHTTGSGKTLTSFKAAQLMQRLPDVEKVLFVVDRADLDYQTTREFNHFQKDSVDDTTNTNNLVKQLCDPNTKLIVTTLQKLNTAITKDRHMEKLAHLKQQRVVFIFDECHRSQFGETHDRIKSFFENHQMFGFTGTPILDLNSIGKRTTKNLFGACLHKYLIPDAVRDGNVLKFSVEYFNTVTKGADFSDEGLPEHFPKDVWENPERIEAVVDWMIANHGKKTHNKDFTAMLCVGSTDALQTYYETFKRKKEKGEHNLRIATIFTYAANEEDPEANGLIGEPSLEVPTTSYKREFLDACVADYNAQFGTKYDLSSQNGFYDYYKNIAKRIKEREKEGFNEKDRVDILLVVNMFLTGFDAKKLNTLYVDKNLKYHGLIQAFSRTNRVLNEVKSQGNIVCFRPLKKATDDAIGLFSNPEAKDEVLLKPYHENIDALNTALEELYAIAPEPQNVDDLPDEDAVAGFVRLFRKVLRLMNVAESFSEFTFDDVKVDPQTLEDFKSKYLDIHDSIKPTLTNEPTALSDLDFELELIQRDEINVTYILNLLAEICMVEARNATEEEAKEQKRQALLNILSTEPHMRSKRQLIENFMDDHMADIKTRDALEFKFKEYWAHQRQKAMQTIVEEESLRQEKVEGIIQDYIYTGQKPLTNDVAEALQNKPKLMERRTILHRVTDRILGFVRTFEDGVDV